MYWMKLYICMKLFIFINLLLNFFNVYIYLFINFVLFSVKEQIRFVRLSKRKQLAILFHRCLKRHIMLVNKIHNLRCGEKVFFFLMTEFLCTVSLVYTDHWTLMNKFN